jgi:hypothetical protein
MENYSLSDIRAATGDDNGWGGDGGWFWIVVLFLFMFGFGGNGFGNNNAATQGALTRADLCQDMNFQQLENSVRGVQSGICDGFYAMNTSLLNGFNGIGNQIAESRFASQQCCCETNRNIDAVRSDNYKNTCDITTAIHSEGEQTRALINANTMQALRDKLDDKDRELQTANFQLSQQAQNAYLIGALKPSSVPAYLTCSPYESNALALAQLRGGCSGCGCA